MNKLSPSSSNLAKTPKISSLVSSVKSDKFLPQSKSISSKKSILKEVIKIKVKVIKVEKLLKNSSVLNTKELLNKRKDAENAKRQEKEEKLEKKKGEKDKSIKTPMLPSMGFLESIGRFASYTFAAWLVNTFWEYLPNLIKLLKLFDPLITFFEFFTKNLFESIVNFIDFSYKVHDKIRDFTKVVGGEPLQKTFDEFTKNLNTFVNLAILAGILLSGGPKTPKGNIQPTRPGRTGRPQVTTTGGRKLGQLDIRNPLRERPRVTTTGGRNLGDLNVRSPLRKGPKITGDVTPTKIGKFGKFGKLGAGRFPIVGPLIDFAFQVWSGQPLGRAAASAAGAAVGQAIGGIIGTFIAGGSAIATGGLGAIVAPLIIGGLQIAGGMLGDLIGSSLYDTVMSIIAKNSKKQYMGGVVSGFASGGKLPVQEKVETEKPIKRTLRRGIQSPSPSPVTPGASVGGEKKVKQIFQEPEQDSLGKVANPFGFLKDTTNSLGEVDFIGPIFSLFGKLLLGEFPSKESYEKIGLGISAWINNGIQQGKLKGDIAKGFADGGVIQDMAQQDISQWAKESVEDLVKNKVNKAIEDFKKNMGLIPISSVDTTPSAYGQGDSTPAGIVFNALLAEGFTSAQAAGVVGNLMQESGGGTKNLNPNADNNVGVGHHGIAQWDKRVRWPRVSAYIKSIGKDPNTVEGQVEGLIWELKTQEKGAYEKLKLAKTPEESAAVFLKEFERSGERPGMAGYDNRIRNAAAIAKEFAASGSMIGDVKGYIIESPTGSRAASLSDLPPHHDYQRSKDGSGRLVQDFTFVKDGRADNVPILSPINGKVIFVGFDAGGYGNYLDIRAADGSIVRMAHFNKIMAKQNSSVSALKSVIGLQGKTGRATGTHVHMEATDSITDAYIRSFNKKQSGGYIGKRINPIQSQASYDDPEQQVVTMIQPIIIEKKVYVPQRNSSFSFSGDGGVNNSKHSQLSVR